MREIYLDNNSTTPLAPEVLEAMLPYFGEFFGNPSSLHKKGIEAERGIKQARQILADILHVKTSEVYFTSGATEADNLAIKGIAYARKKRGNHIITQKTEHEAVLESCRQLEKQGYEVTYLGVDEYGNVNEKDLIAAITDKTILVAIMHVNNEIGTIYPINEFARLCKKEKSDITFFSDGVQAFGKLEINLDNIDLYAISAHKVHGPKGMGALVVKEGKNLEPLISGGGQESNLRSGTENVAGIVGFGKAAELAYENLKNKQKHFSKLRERFLYLLQNSNSRGLTSVAVNSPEDGIAATINVAFGGVPSEVLLHALEERGIYTSSGSACAGGKQSISYVLEAIRTPYEFINSSLRFGFSRYNTLDEIDFTCKVLKELVEKLREVIK